MRPDLVSPVAPRLISKCRYGPCACVCAELVDSNVQVRAAPGTCGGTRFGDLGSGQQPEVDGAACSRDGAAAAGESGEGAGVGARGQEQQGRSMGAQRPGPAPLLRPGRVPAGGVAALGSSMARGEGQGRSILMSSAPGTDMALAPAACRYPATYPAPLLDPPEQQQHRQQQRQRTAAPPPGSLD